MNVCARFLGFILRIDHSLNKHVNTIVISKFVGLGSIIQATPLIQALRKKYPQAKIVFVSTQSHVTILEHIEEIDGILTVSDKSLSAVISSTWKLLRDLWRLKPDLFIDLEFYSNYSSIVTTFSKATNRLGFYKQDKIYRKGVYNYLVPFSVEMPIAETYLQFAKLIGCNDTSTQLKIKVGTGPHAEIIKNKTGLDTREKYIVVNPNASDLRLERRWPASSYASTINHILKTYPQHKIVLIGNKAEEPYVTELLQNTEKSERIINSAGKLSLAELIFLIAHAGVMITNDTGPMHIAFAMNTKTITLFGPCSPAQYGRSGNVTTLYKQVHCSPCVHKYVIPPCKGDNICMKNITVAEVEAAIRNAVPGLESR
jgi:ADP-heptose:LPS heptosyltransferase